MLAEKGYWKLIIYKVNTNDCSEGTRQRQCASSEDCSEFGVDQRGITQHQDIAQDYIDQITTELQSLFPDLSDLDAAALAIGGISSDLQANNPTLLNDLLNSNGFSSLDQANTISGQYKHRTAEHCHDPCK